MEMALHIGWCIVQPIYKLFLILRRKVKFDVGSYISYNVILEGYNYIGRKSQVIASTMGYASYISRNGYLYNTKIGKYTCIGPNVSVICGKHPIRTYVSVHPAFYSKNGIAGLSYVDEQLFEEITYIDGRYSVVIGNDVWIGANVVILEGVTIGDGAIVAAGALVNKDVAPYSVVAGIPAKKIKDRFEVREIQWLKEFRWWDKPEKWIKENINCYSDIKRMMGDK